MTDIQLDEFGEALKARDLAMANVDAGTSDDWKELAHLAGEAVARRQHYLTSEDVRDMLDRHNVPEPKEHRAIGPVMRRLAAAGVIRQTDRHTRYTRRSRHTGMTYLWESLIVQTQRKGST